jgi:hypothetical protein
MIHQQAHSSALVEVGTGLLEQGIDGELEVELLNLERFERLCKRGF